MVSFYSPGISQQFQTGILVYRQITVAAAAGVIGYNIQYLRRLVRSGALEGVKIGQMWLIDMEVLEAFLEHKSTEDYWQIYER